MSGYARFTMVILGAFGLVSAVRAQEPASPSEERLRRLIQRFDADGDGQLSEAERAEAQRQRRQAQRPRRPASQPAEAAIPPGVKVIRDVEYARVDDKALLLDLYLPPKGDEPRPLVVWIHGGGWKAGSKERCPAVPLSGQGFAVASINYRLSTEAKFPAQIHDCKGAMRWLRAHAKEYGFDPERIGVWGSSAGGHLVALLGTSGGVPEVEGDVGGNLKQSSRVQAVCDFCGPSSFREEDLDSREQGERFGGRASVVQLLGGPVGESRDKARQASPVTYVSGDEPPFLIVHGDRDPTVPVSQSKLLAAALKKTGTDATLHIVPGAGHGVMNPRTAAMAAEFFKKHLKK